MTRGTRKTRKPVCFLRKCDQESFFTLVIGDTEILEDRGHEIRTETRRVVHYCSDHTQVALEDWYWINCPVIEP